MKVDLLKDLRFQGYAPRTLLVKIDTQGAELGVLNGDHLGPMRDHAIGFYDRSMDRP